EIDAPRIDGAVVTFGAVASTESFIASGLARLFAAQTRTTCAATPAIAAAATCAGDTCRHRRFCGSLFVQHGDDTTVATPTPSAARAADRAVFAEPEALWAAISVPSGRTRVTPSTFTAVAAFGDDLTLCERGRRSKDDARGITVDARGACFCCVET